MARGHLEPWPDRLRPGLRRETGECRSAFPMDFLYV